MAYTKIKLKKLIAPDTLFTILVLVWPVDLNKFRFVSHISDVVQIVSFVSRNVVVCFKCSSYVTFSYYNQACRGQRRCVESSVGRK